MEAALAEFKAEEVGVDVEEDVDFIMDKGSPDFVVRPITRTDVLDSRPLWPNLRIFTKTWL